MVSTQSETKSKFGVILHVGGKTDWMPDSFEFLRKAEGIVVYAPISKIDLRSCS